MISRRSAVLSALISLPVLIYAILGGYALWSTGLGWTAWWLAPICWGLAWCLGRFWRARDPKEVYAVPVPSYWTPRDRQATEIVRQFQQKVEQFSPDELVDLQVYQREVQALAESLAQHYHPAATDPLSSLTVPEVLAAARLAIEDMEQWLLTSVPGSRMLTIRQWRRLPEAAPKWMKRYRLLQNTYMAASMLWNPANVLQYLTSKLAFEPVATGIQSELLAAVYLRFIQQAGFYLIEMNSGRLRGGADAYRRTLSRGRGHSGQRALLDSVEARSVTVALVGQVSSGKSSLVNALTRSTQAAVDILPETRTVQRYQLSLGKPPVTVTLLDTPGYSEIGATAEQLEQIQAALRETNAVLLVMDAHSPAREADRRTMAELETWYSKQPRLKPPPLVGVLTHVDLLRPVLEWSPPYDWREPAKPKEQSIHDAVEYTRELFAGALVGVVPVCSDARPERLWGIMEELVPALTLVLDEAQSAALLRVFEQELDQGRYKLLFKQVQRLGSDLFRVWVEERLQSKGRDDRMQTENPGAARTGKG